MQSHMTGQFEEHFKNSNVTINKSRKYKQTTGVQDLKTFNSRRISKAENGEQLNSRNAQILPPANEGVGR